MDANWIKFLEKIIETIDQLENDGGDIHLFRGHNNNQWTLTPSLYRKPWIDLLNNKGEENLHFEFDINSGPLYERKLSSWERLFEMRHSGIPTRLLDWTENFGSALFFALDGIDWDKNAISEKKIVPCVWIMDPYDLNETFYNDPSIFTVDELGFEYVDLFNENSERKEKISRISGPIAISPPARGQRCFAQKSIFTLHVGSRDPIENLCAPCVKKFDIPLDSIADAKKFLKMAGINDYSLFPDADGLGRYIVKGIS
jgi:hypothetical protein